jgi:hypothetical protein
MRSRAKNSRSMAARDRRRVARPWHVPASEPRFFNGRGHQAPTAGPSARLVLPMLESVVFLLSLIVLSMPVQAQTPSGTPAPVPGQTVVPSQIIQGPTITIPGQPVNPHWGCRGWPQPNR